MQIKPFSPFNGNPLYRYTSGTEIMFSDSLSSMNGVIIIYTDDFNNVINTDDYNNVINTDDYNNVINSGYILENFKLNGFNNGVDYDYRFDLNDYIKIKYPDTITLSGYSQHVNVIDFKIRSCGFSLYFYNSDFFNINSSLITTLSNGQMFVNNTSLLTGYTSKISDKFFIRFEDIYFDEYVFANSKYNITLTYMNKILDLTFYDSSNNIISGYGTSSQIDNQADTDIYIRTVLFDVPPNAHKMIFNIYNTYNPTSDQIKNGQYIKYIYGCAKNQYFYMGPNIYLGSIVCTGKRETIYDVEKETIKISNKTKDLRILRQKRYSQNTGLRYKQEDIYNMSVSPYLFEIDENNNIIKWLLQNNSVEGYNTKKLSARNLTLDLIRDEKEQFYIDFENNFYN